MSRIVKIDGFPEMTVKQALALREQLASKIRNLPPCPKPEYDGPRGTALTGAIRSLVKSMYQSLSARSAPKDGVTSHFGVSASVDGWTVQMSNNAYEHERSDLVVNVKYKEYYENEDGETVVVPLPKGVRDSVYDALRTALGVLPSDMWDGNTWISVAYNKLCPKSLREAAKRYKAFKVQPGASKFDRWFQAGLSVKNRKRA